MNRRLATQGTLLALAGMLTMVCCHWDGVDEGGLTKRARIEGAIAQEWAATHDPATMTVPRERLVRARAVLLELQRSGRSVGELEWIERGPSGVGGRTRALLFDRNDPTGETVWAGGVSGGLWQTGQISAEDPQWSLIDDFFENMAVSCMVQDPEHPDTLFFGTGEGWFNHDAVRGLGIWRSIDGGQSWQQLPATATPDFYYVMSLALDTEGRLLAATRDAGLLRSSDAGETWLPVLSGITGGVPHSAAADIEVASNGDLFVTFGVYGMEGAVYRSSYAQHGLATGNPGTWEAITPSGNWERIELASAPSEPLRLYLLAQGEGTTKVTGCFRSFDGGSTWESLGNLPVQVGQAWYNLIAKVDPIDPDLWFLGAVRLYRSSDAGQSWQQLEPIHPDHHAIEFDPAVPGRALLGNDGGVYLCNDLSGVSPDLLDRNTGYNVTQFYGAAIHPDPAIDVIFGGTQDNGTLRLTEPGLNGKDQLRQGDGGRAYYDLQQPDLQIGSVLYNRYVVTNDNWATSTSVNLGFSGRFINPSDYDSNTKTLFSGDDGGRYSRWLEVDKCQNAGCSETVEVLAFDSAEVTAVALDPHRSGAVYFGLRNGRVVRVPDAASVETSEGEWLNGGSQMPEGWVSCVAADPVDSLHLIVTISNYGIPGVWETTDGGQSWVDIHNNLPDLPVRWAVFQPGQSDRVLLATDLGVWMCETLLGGQTVWEPAGNGLANTRVDHLQFREADQLLIAATHGRGIFSTSFFSRPALSFSSSFLAVSERDTGLVPLSFSPTCSDSVHQVSINVVASPSAFDTIEVLVRTLPGGTATSGRDFLLQDSVVLFGPGLPDTQAVSLLIVQDGVVEGDETLELELNWADTVPATEGPIQVLELLIQDDEYHPDTVTSGTAVASVPGSVRSVWIEAGETAHLTDTTGGLLASVTALESACYTVTLLRTGADTLVPVLLSPEGVFRRCWRVETEAMQPYQLTLYFAGTSYQTRPDGTSAAIMTRSDTFPEEIGLDGLDPFLVSIADSFGLDAVYSFSAEVTGSGVFSLGTGLPGPLDIDGEIWLSGRLEQREAVLSWQWGSENAVVEQWQVERSDGTAPFVPVDSVNGITSGEELSWRGEQPAAPQQFWYYRVTAAIDQEKDFLQSNVVALRSSEERVRIFPVPANQSYTICLPESWLERRVPVLVELFDTDGRLVEKNRQEMTCQEYPSAGIRGGMYLIKLTAVGRAPRVARLIVSH